MFEGDAGYCYENVKKWAKKIKSTGRNVFKLRYMFIPCNISNSHWCLCVADIANKRIQYFDSMGGDGFHFMRGLQQYFKDEVRRAQFTWHIYMENAFKVPTCSRCMLRAMPAGKEALAGRFSGTPPRLGHVGALSDGHGLDAAAG